MKICLFFVTLLFYCYSFSQDSKKLLKILGDGYQQMDPVTNYSNQLPQDVKIYESYFRIEESEYYKKDTTGISNQIEFLRFRENLSQSGKESFKFFKMDLVSQNDYNEFIEFVKDSIYREYIYKNDDPTGEYSISEEVLVKMLKIDPAKAKVANYTAKKMDPSEPYANRGVSNFDYKFDWRKKINYYSYYPIISNFTFRAFERIDRKKDHDFRKVIYKYSECPNGINVYPDQSVWSIESQYPNDVYDYMSKYYYLTDNPDPAQGVKGNQVKAYLNYIEKKLQHKIDQKKLPYHIKVTLPDINEIKGVEGLEYYESIYFDSLDMNTYWQITNAEYYKFLDWVKDSIIREVIFDRGQDVISSESIAELLDYEKIYYDEANMYWTEFDPSDLITIRYEFDFNWKKDWRSVMPQDPEEANYVLEYLTPYKKKVDYKGDFMVEDFDPMKLFYKYYWKDWKSMSNDVGMNWNESKQKFEVDKENWERRRKDLDLGYGVFSHDDMSRLIVRENLNIYPGQNCRDCNVICISEHGQEKDGKCGKCKNFGEPLEERDYYDFKSDPEGLVQNLTYEQAIAFYHWSYVKGYRTPKDSPIPEFYCPSKEEFEKVQKGEKIPVRTIEITYPTPMFRYVIHVFPK